MEPVSLKPQDLRPAPPIRIMPGSIHKFNRRKTLAQNTEIFPMTIVPSSRSRIGKQGLTTIRLHHRFESDLKDVHVLQPIRRLSLFRLLPKDSQATFCLGNVPVPQGDRASRDGESETNRNSLSRLQSGFESGVCASVR